MRILKVDRSDRNNVKVAASVKRAQKNPFEKAIQKYGIGSHYIGTVTMVDPNGVFVAMEAASIAYVIIRNAVVRQSVHR